jgi:hypothetical protein
MAGVLKMRITVKECGDVAFAAIMHFAAKGAPEPSRFSAYSKVWARVYEQSGAPYSTATPRLICLTNRITDLLS